MLCKLKAGCAQHPAFVVQFYLYVDIAGCDGNIPEWVMEVYFQTLLLAAGPYMEMTEMSLVFGQNDGTGDSYGKEYKTA